ncbi:hypothetical protein K435DRAFT_822829 [Dendrothele bispora CBS 962.96]|uniref:FAD/NAD(P)-binding domain-containing protein n=1 Tax=Dendrothele bispora (strain CBS 962.96) TaxID=1314807 RepID=A0A4S8L6E9_DENBC|nr:hypothetical protein K435DRAFT_822829 [Dendrothele bispora CBS 962.96]
MASPLVVNAPLPSTVCPPSPPSKSTTQPSSAPSLIQSLIQSENVPGFPTRILGPRLMTISKIDLSHRPFRYWREGQEDEEPETADTVIVATGASAKRLGLKGEEAACAVFDGAVLIFRCVFVENKPLADIGGGDSAAKEATSPRFEIMAKQPMNSPKILPKCQGDSELLKELRIRNVQAGEDKDLAVNGLFYTLEAIFAARDVQDKWYRQAITSAGSGCMAALEAEWLIAEEEMIGE